MNKPFKPTNLKNSTNPKISIRKVKTLNQYYWYLQTNPAGSLAFCICLILYASVVALFDWNRPTTLKLGAYHKGKLIGLLSGDIEYSRINFLHVKKKYRSKGIGKRLVERSGFSCVVSSKKAFEYWFSLGYTKRLGSCFFMKEDSREGGKNNG